MKTDKIIFKHNNQRHKGSEFMSYTILSCKNIVLNQLLLNCQNMPIVFLWFLFQIYAFTYEGANRTKLLKINPGRAKWITVKA